jgi:hypothetical protein
VCDRKPAVIDEAVTVKDFGGALRRTTSGNASQSFRLCIHRDEHGTASSQRERRANDLDVPALEACGEHEHEDTRGLAADAEKEWGTPRGKYTNAPCSARNRSSPQTKSTVP